MRTRLSRSGRGPVPPVAVAVSMLAEWVQSTYDNVTCDQLTDAMLRAVGLTTVTSTDPLLDGDDILTALHAGLALARDPKHAHVEPVTVLHAA